MMAAERALCRETRNSETSWLAGRLKVSYPTQPYGLHKYDEQISSATRHDGGTVLRALRVSEGSIMPLLSVDPRDLELLRIRDTPRQL